MNNLIGRANEMATFKKLGESRQSEFVAVFGRRRVGKTFLIRQAYNNEFDFQLTGMANTNLPQQLANFHAAITRHDASNTERQPAKSWFEAMQQLIVLLEKKTKKKATAKKVIFFDELPWLDSTHSGFLPALEHFWNSWATSRTNIVMIVCGSAASWMINKLINNKGGLHNRVTQRIKLDPFTLAECEAFFKSKHAVFDRYQLIQLYMAIGGIPYYLEHVDPGMSAAQNIDKLCFESNGPLRTEFDNLYSSLFNHADRHVAIVEALSKKTKGLTREELIAATAISNGGGLSRILLELEESSFIRRYNSFGKKGKYSIYQLTDCYSLFYLKFIRDSNPLDEHAWLNGLDEPKQRAWGGYAFEQVCLMHIKQIKKALGISGVQTSSSSWISVTGSPKVQIDLLIDRRDQVINLCEMKFSINRYTIDKKYAEELRNKVSVFKTETGSRKSVFLTMITTFGLQKNEHATSLVQNDLTMDMLFD